MSDFWQETISSATQLRHELHQYPELGWSETSTAERIRATLNQLAIDWRPCAHTGTLATLNPQGTGPHIALRGDIDALPIHEKTGATYQSHHAGCMHACGHDGHTATLMATARWLKHHEHALEGPVTLIFQPAEEGGHGAREMIAEGALDGVDCIYGWHNWPALPFGEMVCPDGLVMCGNGTFTLTVRGQGGHASQPDNCRDPIVAASAITLALQQIASRRVSPTQSVVVSVTAIDAPSGPTVIPEHAVIGGSIRIPNEQLREQVNKWITDIALCTAHSYGVDCEIQFETRYQATINHPEPAATMREAWQQINTANALNAAWASPIMASEDFSYYLREIPGAFALVGADDGGAHNIPCHSAYYDFNDRLIEKITRLFSHLVGIETPADNG